MTHRPVTPHAILSTKLVELQRQLQEHDVTSSLTELAAQCVALAQPLDDYIARHTSRPSPELDELEAQTNQMDWDAGYAEGNTTLPQEKEMVSGAVEGQFLQMLVSIAGAKRVLEIGSFTGYASLAMAEALPPGGKLIACEYDPFTADFARKQLDKSTHGNKVKIVVGDANQTLEDLGATNEYFDLVFIDADKTNYLNYYNAVLEHSLLSVGGLICVDNTLYKGQVYGAGTVNDNGKALQAFNTAVADDERVQQVLLPLRDGLTLIRRVA